MSIKHLAYLLILSIFAAGCAASINMNDEIIATVGNKKITYGEFEQQYAQNSVPNSDSVNSVSSKKHFLNLLIDYNLKLMDARKEHLLQQPAVKSEMTTYETQLAVSYVLEHEITDPMVRKIYNRRKYEVRADQVFIRISPDSANPKGDTLKAYNEAMSVIHDLKAGAPIDSLIHLYRGGDTYYITAGTFLQYQGGEQFENMLYTLKPGEVGSEPVRTPFGYLVIKLIDKRPRYESIRASHILIKIDGNSPADTLKAYDKAMAVLDSAKNGVDFAKLARDNSADSMSAIKGGDLGWFHRGMMVRPFDEAVFNIKKVGGLAGPVRSRFGYHIIKLTGVKPVRPYSEVKNELRSSYLKGGFKYDYANLIDTLRNRLDFTVDNQVVNMLYSKVDSNKAFQDTDFDSLLTPSELSETIFTFDGEKASVDTLLSLVKSSGKFAAKLMSRAEIETFVNDIGSDMVLAHYAVAKARTYPEFDSLILKYEDGILIYQIEQQQIWDKVATSDSVLKPYYEAHAASYTWPRRVDLGRIVFPDKKIADSVYAMLQNGADFDTLAARFNSNKELKDKAGEWGLFADSASTIVTQAFGMKAGEYCKPELYEGAYTIIKVKRFVPAGPKTFEEARGEVSAEYQDYESHKLRTEWMKRLREEFGVKVNQKTFDELVAKE